jgi:hypothetical protein
MELKKMGRIKSAKIVYTETGKILAYYRFQYCETAAKQAKRLGFNAMYISLVSNGHRRVTPSVYCSIVEHYPLTEKEKEAVLKQMCDDEIYSRFEDVLPGSKLSVAEKVYLITGFRDQR